MISSFQYITALGLSARSELCPVSLSKWTWHVSIWTWYLCVHHSSRAEILLNPEILADRFWSDKTSLHNFSGAVLCILLYFAIWDRSIGHVRHHNATAVHVPEFIYVSSRLVDVAVKTTLFAGAVGGVQPNRCGPRNHLVSQQTLCGLSWKLHMHSKMGF